MKILITGVSWKIGMAAAFSLSKEGFTLAGTDERPLPFKMHSRHLSSYYIHAPFSGDRFYQDILSIIKKENPDVLLIMGGTKQVSIHKEEFTKYVNLLVPDYDSYCTVYDKKKTHLLCREMGIPVPDRFSDREAEYLLKDKKNLRLVVKPDYDIGGANGLSYVSTFSELEEAKKTINKRGGNYLIEEFIPGASNMRAVQLVFDKEHKISACFILKKLYQWPFTGGITAYAESTHEWNLVENIIPFFERCPWEGPVEAEFIIDERDGKPKLIEINPRFAGSIAFAIGCGVNFPLIVCMDSMNECSSKKNPEYQAGMYYINSSYYLKAAIKELKSTKNKPSFLLQKFGELKRKKTGTMLDKRDFPVYLVKALMEIKDSIFSRLQFDRN